jgi:hypothetical protein
MVGQADLKHMNHLMREFDALRLGEMGDFIGAFREHRKQLRANGPAQVDMLSRFGISMSETQHSAFLAWLLDAGASHNQGDLFLRTFLAVCRPKPEVVIPGEYHVQTEFWGGRSSIDILLYQPGEFLLYIENKTVSPDTRGQLEREFEDMCRLGRAFAIPTHRQVAVYLTPAGREHPDPVYREEWYSASYTDLGQALGALLPRLGDARLKFALETWLDAISIFTGTWRQTMKGFSEESVLIATHWTTVLKIMEARERTSQELGGILSSVEAELKTGDWWQSGWRAWPDGPGFYISHANWELDDGWLPVWIGVYDFDADHVFGLGIPPTLYVGFREGYEDLKHALLDKWGSQYEVGIRYDEDSPYPIVQDLPKCLEEEGAVRAYPQAVREQMLDFFTRYAARLMDADELIREHVPGGQKRKSQSRKR